MKNLNLFESNVSGMDREWIENGSGLTRHHGKLWKYVAMIFAVLTLSIANVGMAWGYWYLPANIHYDAWGVADNQMNSATETEKKIVFYNVPAGTYYFSLTNGTNWSGSCIRNTYGSISSSGYQDYGDHRNYFTTTEACDIWFEVVDETNWKVDISTQTSSYFIKYKWNNGTASWSNPLTGNGDGTYSCVGQYGGTKSFEHTRLTKNHTSGTSGTATISGDNPSTGDMCVFTYKPADNSLTIRKCSDVNKGSGSHTIYFDNAESNWSDSKKYFVIGRPCTGGAAYSKVYTLSSIISNTKLCYVVISDVWNDAAYYGVIGTGSSTWTEGSWSWSNLSSATHYSAPYLSKHDLVKSKASLVTKTSADNGGALTFTQYDEGKKMKVTQTINYVLSVDGGSTYAVMSSSDGSTPAKLEQKYYKWNSNTALKSQSTNTLNYGNTTYTKAQSDIAYRSKVNVKYDNLQTGYEWVGWYDGNTQLTTNSSYEYYPNADLTLSARFKAKNYTVTLDDDGGSGGSGTVTAYYKASTNLTSSVSVPTKDGFEFGGYFTAKNGGGTQLINADGSWKASVSGYTDSNKKWQATSNTKVYAKWTATCSTPAAPTAFATSSVWSTSATFTITDAGDAASYDLYYASGSPSDPTSGTTATTNVTTKTPTITGLTASTSYKIWVRSVCDASHKSSWVALGTTSFTTLDPPCFVYTGGTKADSGWPVAASGSITTALYKSDTGASLSGGTITNSGSGSIGSNNGVKGLVFDGTSEQITVTLTGGNNFGVGTIIVISGASGDDNSSSHSFGFSANGVNLPTVSKSGASQSFETSYTVTSSDGIDGESAIIIKLNTSCNRKTYLKGVTVYECSAVSSFTLTNAVSPAGYGTVSPTSVTDITSGTTTSSSTNTYTVNGTTVTATPADATAEYTYAFSSWSNLPATVTENATVTANFTRTPVSYTLTWVTDGDPLTGDYTTGTVPFGTAIVAPNTPTKTGYTFSAWTPAVAGTMPATNTTYTATWTLATYSITYNLHDGGAGSVSGKTSYQITDDDYDLPTPVWTGHTFLGWYATYSAGVYSDPVSVLTSGSTGNKTYHAKWADGVNVVWTITKVDSKLYKGGTGYSVKAVVDNTSWTGHDNLVLSASDGVTLGTPTKSTVDSKAQIVADFSISGSLADDAITFSLYAPATGVYAAIEDEKEVELDECPSAGGSTTLFSQNFNDATSIAYAAATEREYTTSTGTNNVVGNGDNLFTFIKTIEKNNCGIGQNNESGGNSRDYTKKFGAYYNNTNSGGIWAIVRNADFAATAPTALKMEFKLLVKYIAGGTPIEFAIGDGFSNAIAAPAFNKAYTGFGIYTSSASNIAPCQFGGTSTLTTVSSRKIDDDTEISYTWVINGTGETITYDAPNGEEKELADGKWDLWKGTVILINSQSRTASGSTAFSGAKMQELYIGNPQGKKGDITLDEIVITNLSSAGGGSTGIETSLAWSDDDATAGTVNKNDNDGDFRIYASPTPANAGGTITYNSSNTSVATVSSDGTVHIVNDGSTTITASMSAYGCYSPAEPITYSLVVANTCSDTPGTIVNNDGSAIAGNAVNRGACETLTLKLTGHSGSTIQWKKDGVNIPSANAATYSVPTGESGVYSATITGICTLTSTNSITVTTAGVPEPTIFADDFYVKSGKWFGYRLMQINRGETVTVKTAPTGWTENTDFSITTDASGIVSISGRKTISTPANKTLTLTIANECDGSVDKNITIREMAATAKPTIAWIATNNKGGSGQKDNVKADESTNTDLYDHLDDDYIITPRNCYWTTNEADLVKEYSQYDLIILTDYPNSGTCPSGKSGKSNSYTNAIGLLIDHKPIMTFEAFVAGCPNWGIASDPQNTQATQADMTLLCNADEIFGTSGKFAAGEAITVTSASSGQALQGFPVASSPDFVFIGKITDSDEKTYVACCERQHEIAARMMVFGLNSSIMSSLTDDGKTMVKGFIDYLLKDDPASVPDCSVIFNGGGGDDSWYTTSNWEAGLLPDQYASVRIDAPCVVPANANPAKAGGIKIHVGDMNSGSLTIEPEGRMIVEKTITRIEGNAYTIHMPTEPEDLIIQSDETAQGALIFDNESGTTQATVEMYSKGRYYDGVYNWQYVAVPLVSASRWNMGDWAYCFDNSIGNWTGNDVCPAFSAVGVTRMDAELPTYEFYGPLASTKNQTLTLYTSAAGNDGYNMIGNSWTAPIQIVNFQPGDFGTALYQVNIYNTGHDPEDGPAAEESKDQQGRWKTIPIASAQAAIDAGTWEDLKVIPSMQAFEVQNATGANTTLTLNYDRLVRTLPTEPNLNETKRAPRRTPVERTAVPQMRITLKDETTRENLYLFSGEQFSEGFDNGWDGVYNAGEAGYMQIYMLSPIGNLEISAQPEMEGTTFGFTAGSREVYTFSFKYVGNEELYFNDLKEKKSTLINDENEYTFTAQEGENGIRFMISATPYNSQQITTGMTDLDAEAPQAQKVIYNDKLFIIRSGKVFSADGQLVK